MPHLRCVVVAFALSLLPSAFAQSNSAPIAKTPFEQLRDATQLNRKDAQPFHLKLDVQLYDLRGKPSHTGAIEEWWVSPDEYWIEINNGSQEEVTATGQTTTIVPPNRDSYLLNQLQEQTVSPLQAFHSIGTPAESKQTFGNTQLDCFVMSAMGSMDSTPTAPPPMYCTDPSTQTLRVMRNGFEVLVRNLTGKFRNTSIALSSTIYYFGHPAVSGKIATLEPFAPGSPGAPQLQPSPEAKQTSALVPMANGVRGGRILKKMPPMYPEYARGAHIGGTVLLHGVITKEGKVASLFAIASPDESLSAAAIDAVRDWRYEPYLLNGNPTEVDSVIQINFNLNVAR